MPILPSHSFHAESRSHRRWVFGALVAALLGLAVPGFAGDRAHRGGIFRDGCSPALLAGAEHRASPAGAQILAQARRMTVDDNEILPGACWDYINAVYTRAGYPARGRETAFKSKKAGPYARADQIQAGDWLYFINHSYGGVEHSSLFVAWKDKAALQAYMCSYPGEQRRETARYLIYDLSGVYQVIRPKA